MRLITQGMNAKKNRHFGPLLISGGLAGLGGAMEGLGKAHQEHVC